jgi:hypothetical protein
VVLGFGAPVLATGGGGYHVENTVRGWALRWSILCGEGADNAMSLGLGGVMLESTEWHGGLRDRPMISHAGRRAAVDEAIERTVGILRRELFPLHGL